MQSLPKDLQEKKLNIQAFGILTKRILSYLPDVLSGFKEKSVYRIYFSDIAGTKKYVRPINTNLFYTDPDEFDRQFMNFLSSLKQLKQGKRTFTQSEQDNIDKTLYTIQQSIGAGLDLLVNPNSARKHVGNRFEELIRAVFTEMGVANKKTVLQIPYETDEGQKIYKCENDLILSPFEEVKSSSRSLDEKELVVSVKTTSKDRMGKMFIDKMLIERFVKHDQKIIGIFLNDVQRKDHDNISYTLVSGLFMVYTKFLTTLEGIYYLDPPPNAKKLPYSNHMKPFSNLLTIDVWQLLAS